MTPPPPFANTATFANTANTTFPSLSLQRLGPDVKALILVFIVPVLLVLWPLLLLCVAVSVTLERGFLVPLFQTLATQDICSPAIMDPDSFMKPLYAARVRSLAQPHAGGAAGLSLCPCPGCLF